MIQYVFHSFLFGVESWGPALKLRNMSCRKKQSILMENEREGERELRFIRCLSPYYAFPYSNSQYWILLYNIKGSLRGTRSLVH